MVTIRPLKNIEVHCNSCDMKLGIIKNDSFQPEDPDPTTFMRFRMYDIRDDGERLNAYDFEIDLCATCMKIFEPIIKKLGLTKSKVIKT